MSRKKKFPWPHHIDEETKIVSVYVVSGYPTVMIVPKMVKKYFPGYESRLVSQEYLEKLTNGNAL